MSRTLTRRGLITRTAIAATLALGLLAGAGCTTTLQPTGSTIAPTSPPNSRTLSVGATAEPKTMDPTADAAVAGSQVMLYNVYETLLKTDADGVLEPLLAQRWQVSADRKTYTFSLNPAAKFASGKAVTADAVVKNIQRIQTGSVAAKLKNQMAIVTSAKAVDSTTVEVGLSRPSNTWLYDMSSTQGMIMDPEGFSAVANATAGSGPYALKQWNKGDSVVLGRNAAYWGTPGRYDMVTFKYFADPNAMNASMLSGELDVISNLQAPDSLAQFAGTPKYTVTQGGTNAEVVLGLNNSSVALKDIRVRQAIAMAIDKKALVQDAWAGKGQVIGTMDVPTDPYYEDLSGVNAYNPTQAKALLQEAGYATGLTLRLKPAALPYATASAQIVASQLKAVGISTTIEELQFPARWLDVVYTKADYDLTIVAHAEARDLSNYTNPAYYWRYDNATYNQLFSEADQAAPDQYPALMKKAARFLADDAPSVWLFMLPSIVVTKSGVTGVPKNATSLSFDVTTIATR